MIYCMYRYVYTLNVHWHIQWRGEITERKEPRSAYYYTTIFPIIQYKYCVKYVFFAT